MRGAHAHIKVAAYHEAGHALAAIREGFRVELAQISRRAPGVGRVFIINKSSDRNPFIPSAGAGAARAAWEVSLQRRLPSIRINLAGPLAEARFLGQPLRTLGALSDLSKCERIAATLGTLHEALSAYGGLPTFCPFDRIAEERKRLRRWLARPRTWRTITAIAEALIDRAGLSEQELLQIYLTARSRADQSVLPLVKIPSPSPRQTKPRKSDLGDWTVQVPYVQPTQLTVPMTITADCYAKAIQDLYGPRPVRRRRVFVDQGLIRQVPDRVQHVQPHGKSLGSGVDVGRPVQCFPGLGHRLYGWAARTLGRSMAAGLAAIQRPRSGVDTQASPGGAR